MAAKLVVLYRKPGDAQAFDAHYFEKHVPIAKRIPGLVRYEVSDGVASPFGAPAVHLVATLEFASMADLRNALGSPEGRAAAADVPNFASGGADMLMFETKDV